MSFEQCVIKSDIAVHDSRCEELLPKHTTRCNRIHNDHSEYDSIISNGRVSGRNVFGEQRYRVRF